MPVSDFPARMTARATMARHRPETARSCALIGATRQPLDGHRYAQPHTLEARCIRATEEDLERDSEKVAR
jgi:hypothetical protein